MSDHIEAIEANTKALKTLIATLERVAENQDAILNRVVDATSKAPTTRGRKAAAPVEPEATSSAKDERQSESARDRKSAEAEPKTTPEDIFDLLRKINSDLDGDLVKAIRQNNGQAPDNSQEALYTAAEMKERRKRVLDILALGAGDTYNGKLEDIGPEDVRPEKLGKVYVTIEKDVLQARPILSKSDFAPKPKARNEDW